MLRNLFISAASIFALGSGSVMASGDYLDGLKMGGLITTCEYHVEGLFSDPRFGPYMIQEQYNQLSSSEQRAIIKLWNQSGDSKCIHASHGHSH
jgi:hypothetical protein